MTKKGETRNPYGRKGKESSEVEDADPDMVAAALEKALKKKVPVTRSGRKSKVAIVEALCEQVSTEALSGDRDARKMLTQLMRIRASAKRQPPSVDQKTSAPAAEELDEATAQRTIDDFLRLHGVEDGMQAGMGTAEEAEGDSEQEQEQEP